MSDNSTRDGPPAWSSLRARAKRAFDLAAAGAGLVASAPVIAVAAAAIVAEDPGNPFFTQVRTGEHGKLFRVYKLRTMTHAKGADGQLLPDDQRLTPLGKFLRNSSIDELPQLLNVVKGDMSLVGPRPLLVQYLGRYSPEQARRLAARPGITGWAQIHGRNAVSWDEKFAMDAWYVDHWSPALDARILLASVGKVLFPQGITAQGHATMPEFTGSKPEEPA